MKKISIISLITFLGILFLSAIYVFAKPLQNKVSSQLNEETEWEYIGMTEVVDLDDNGQVRNSYRRPLYVKVINNQFFYRIEDTDTYSITKNTGDLVYEYNATYSTRDKYNLLNVPRW